MGIEVFRKHLREKRAIKLAINAGASRLDLVEKLSRAAQDSKVSAIDVTFNKKIIDTVRKNSKLPIFISSFQPFDILDALKLGVEGIQVGNYTRAYSEGKILSYDEVYDMALESISIASDYDDVFICVTVPSFISFDKKVEFVKKLEILGVDLIQTEGYRESVKNPKQLVYNANESIETMIKLSKYTSIPFAVSSLNSSKTVVEAFNRGTNAVTIEGLENKGDTEVFFKTALMDMVGSLSYRNSLNKEIIRTHRELSLN